MLKKNNEKTNYKLRKAFVIHIIVKQITSLINKQTYELLENLMNSLGKWQKMRTNCSENEIQMALGG